MDRKPTPDYFGEWFNAVPARWYGMLVVLVVLVAGLVAGIFWVKDKGLDWWWIVSGVFVILLFICFSFLSYRKVAIQRDNLVHQLNTTKERLDKVQTISQGSISSHQYIPDSYIKDRTIYLMDLVAPGSSVPIIKNRTIENCEIRGPAMIAFASSITTIDGGSFDGNIDSLFIEVPLDRSVSGAIGLESCVLRNCHYVQIGIIGTKEHI